MSGIAVRVARRVPAGTVAARVLAFVCALALAFVVLLPVLIIVFTAFKPAAEINAFPPDLVPSSWTLANFTRIFTDLPFARLLANSFAFAGGVTACALVFD